MMAKTVHVPDFVKETDGTVFKQAADGATLPAGTYYADFGPGVERSSFVGPHFIWDGVIVASGVTFEGTGFSDADLKAATGAASGWDVEAAGTTFAIAAAAGQNKQHWLEFCSHRARAKIVVTTQGKLRLSVATKGA